MSGSQPKHFEDLPQFLVTAVERVGTRNDGIPQWHLSGTFNQHVDLDQHWAWYLLPGRQAFTGIPVRYDPATLAAVLNVSDPLPDNLLGQSCALLSSRWQAFHVWMVLEPDWPWTRTTFAATDAFTSAMPADVETSIGKRKVESWRTIRPADSNEIPADGETRLLGGWDHEHCTLCQQHIYSGQDGYLGNTNCWLCLACYERYVVPHDLSFTDRT